MKDREQVASILREIKTLPTLPDVATRVLEMTQNPDVSPRELTEMVESDPAIATRLLKLVNSPFFGVRGTVTSVQQALIFVGVSNLRNLVLSTAVMDLFDTEGSVGSFNRKELWEHSIATAIAARFIARETRLLDPDIAFTAGLIHDVGKVVIDRHFREDFERIIQLVDSHKATMCDAETAVLGLDHSEVGLFLAERWNLPEPLREAIGYHHDPRRAPSQQQLAALINLADIMARKLKAGSGGGVDPKLTPDALQSAKMESDQFDELQVMLEDVLQTQLNEMRALTQ
jgi:putative nucleotidyltransferase with HDIG domain